MQGCYMKKILLFILSSLVTLDLHAATNDSPGQKWYGPYTITKVARYWDGGAEPLFILLKRLRTYHVI